MGPRASALCKATPQFFAAQCLSPLEPRGTGVIPVHHRMCVYTSRIGPASIVKYLEQTAGDHPSVLLRACS